MNGIKRILLASVMTVGVAAIPASAQQEAATAFVDLNRIFEEYPKTKAAQDQLKQLGAEYQSEREKMLDEYETSEKVLNILRDEAQNPALSEDARSLKKTEWEDKIVAIRELEGKIRRSDELNRKRVEEKGERMLKDIVDEILESLNSFARKQGYSWVMDYSGKSMNRVPTVLYVDSKFDITSRFLDVLNATAASAGAPSTGN